MNKFSAYDIFINVISCITYILDTGTDIGLILYFFINGYQVWGALTLGFVTMAMLTMQVFSFHWHITDRTMSWKILAVHLLFLAPFHRYVKVLKLGMKSRKTGDPDDLDTVYKEVNDICILRLFETFLEAAPQLILQLYIIFMDTLQLGPLIGLSTFFSLLSIAWSLTSYTDALHLAYKKFYKRSFVAMFTQTLWQIGMVMSRVFAIVLFATVFQSLVLVPLGVHLILMIIWITIIKPDFGATACERHMFTFVSALIHTFCFLNLKDGQSRWRMLIYYVLVLIENSLMILLWFIYKLSDAPHWLVPLGFSVVFGGFLFGVIFLMLYYGFCHASGPVPIPPPKPEFHKPPANVDQSLKHGFDSLKNQIPLFDVSSRSERINLWLSASLDLSKEGLCGDPSSDNPEYTSLHTPGNRGDTGDHSYSRMMRTPLNTFKTSQELQHPSYPDRLCLSSYSNRTDDRMNANMSAHDFSAASQNRLNQSYPRQGHGYGGNDSRISLKEVNNEITNLMRLDSDRLLGEHSPDSQYRDSQYGLDSNHSVPDQNLVEMFSRCKVDPSYVSNFSINDSVFHISPAYTPERDFKESVNISNMSANSQNNSQTKGRKSRYSNDSCDSRMPTQISPLDPYKLWVESQDRMGKSPGIDQLFYQPHFNGNARDDTNGTITILPDESRGISHLSLSYPDNNDLTSSSHDSLRKTDSAGSVYYSKDPNASRESVYLNRIPLNKSQEISFSNMSLPLPDMSYNQSRSQGHTSGSSSSGYYGNTSEKSTPYRHQHIDRSLNSYRDETSPSDRHSSYSSDKGLSMSDRALTSGSETCERSQRSFTSSGFQSEESNLSSGSPAYANEGHLKTRFQSTPIVENEIPLMRASNVGLTETVHRAANEDEDINSSQVKTQDTSKTHARGQTSPGEHASMSRFPLGVLKEGISFSTLVENEIPSIRTSAVGLPETFHHPSNEDEDIYRHQVGSQGVTQAVVKDQMAADVRHSSSSPQTFPGYDAESLMLPPLLSRRSSSAGSSGSGRFFKDPILDDDTGGRNTVSSDESQYPQSTDSSIQQSQFNEKSSLSAMISDMSSSKYGDTHSSDESLSVRSERMMPSFNEINHSEDVNRTRSLPYIHRDGEHNTSPDPVENKLFSAPVYENIKNYYQDRHGPIPADVEKTQNSSSMQRESNANPTGQISLTSEPQQSTGFSDEKEQERAHNSGNPVDDLTYSPQRFGRGVDLFNRDRWRASLDKEMRERLVSDLERLAPRKLYQLQNKNSKKKLNPMELTEYTESPYKFRKPADRDDVVQKKHGTVLANSFDSKQSDYENIKNINSNTDYENISPNYLNQVQDYENVFNSKELLCPVARPESLTDTCSLASGASRYSSELAGHGLMRSPAELYSVRGELYLESFLDSIVSRSDELSRTKSPINTSGVNSAFKPVISRNKSNDNVTQENTNKTFTAMDTSSKENSSLSKNKDKSLLLDKKELSLDNEELSFERCYNANRSVDKSIERSKTDRSRRRSDVSKHSSLTENNNSTFPWSAGEDSSLSTSSHSFVNYLNLVGYPMDFSSSKVPSGSASKVLTDSYSDSIPWEDSMNKSVSFQNKSSGSIPKSYIRQPLRALDNTPVFSPIYGQDRRQSIETSARKRFMSTPKLSSGSDLSLSENLENSGSLSDSRRKYLDKSNDSGHLSKSRNKSFSKSAVTFDQNGENTSTWSTQRSFGEKSSLSATTYI